MQISPPSILSINRESGAGFSLVEIVVTLAVILVLMAIALPLFMPSDANARKAGRGIVSGTLAKARAHAISSGIDTAVVVTDINDSGNDYRGKRMALFEVKSTTVSGEDYQSVKQLGRWISLPDRVIMVDDAGIRGTNVQQGNTKIAVKLPGGVEISAPAMVFSSTGSVVAPSGTGVLEIHLASGSIASGNVVRNVNKGTDVIEIGRLSGRARIREDL